MKINKLILSGASTKVPAYVGVIKALVDNNIINLDLEGIDEIHVCSISMLISLFMLFDMSPAIMDGCCMGVRFENLIQVDKITIRSLFEEYGVSDNLLLGTAVRNMIKEKYNKEDMTLKELYEIKPILLNVKCTNVNKSCVEYFNVHTHPDISIITLLCMTTAIPFLFKPVEYKGCLYVDGGTHGSFNKENMDKTSLGIWIRGESEINETKVINMFDYCQKVLMTTAYDKKHMDSERIIHIVNELHFSEFSVSDDIKIKLMQDGYNQTVDHIKKYNLTNDLFSD